MLVINHAAGIGLRGKAEIRLGVDDRWSDGCALKYTLREHGGESKRVIFVVYRRSWEETGQEEYDQRAADQYRVLPLQLIVARLQFLPCNRLVEGAAQFHRESILTQQSPAAKLVERQQSASSSRQTGIT